VRRAARAGAFRTLTSAQPPAEACRKRRAAAYQLGLAERVRIVCNGEGMEKSPSDACGAACEPPLRAPLSQFNPGRSGGARNDETMAFWGEARPWMIGAGTGNLCRLFNAHASLNSIRSSTGQSCTHGTSRDIQVDFLKPSCIQRQPQAARCKIDAHLQPIPGL